ILCRFARDVEGTRAHLTESLELATRHGHLDYQAAGQANRAWLELVTGDSAAAQESARAALDIWLSRRAGRYPFRWLACLPLLDRALESGDLELAAEQARLLLAPKVRRASWREGGRGV